MLGELRWSMKNEPTWIIEAVSKLDQTHSQAWFSKWPIGAGLVASETYPVVTWAQREWATPPRLAISICISDWWTMAGSSLGLGIEAACCCVLVQILKLTNSQINFQTLSRASEQKMIFSSGLINRKYLLCPDDSVVSRFWLTWVGVVWFGLVVHYFHQLGYVSSLWQFVWLS